MEDVSLHRSVAQVAGFWMTGTSDKNMVVQMCQEVL